MYGTDCESSERIITAQRMKIVTITTTWGNLAELTAEKPDAPIFRFAAMSALRVEGLSSPIAQGS